MCVKGGYFKKSQLTNCDKMHFENGGTTIKVSILHVLLNMLSISSLPRVHDMSVNFELQKEWTCHFNLLEKINKMQVAS